MYSDHLITYIPIGIRSNSFKPGLFVSPAIVSALSRLTNSKSIIRINNFDSHSKINLKKINKFSEHLKKVGINDEVNSDIHFVDAGLMVLEKLVQANLVYEKTKNVYICDCGKVEYSEDGMPNRSKYTSIHGKTINWNVNTKLDKNYKACCLNSTGVK